VQSSGDASAEPQKTVETHESPGEVGELRDKIKKLEGLLSKCKDLIKTQKEQIAELEEVLKFYKGKETVVVVAEVRLAADGEVTLDDVRHSIHHRTLEVCGLPPRDVMLVRPGTLPKTSSGKLQRARCRELYLGEVLELA
jgi:acyl-CoA synthetase (AMP-forming)/AMP-acid ligase II